MKVKREIQSSSVDKLNRIVDLSVCFYTNKEWINCDWRLSKHRLLVSKMFEIKKKTKKQNKTKNTQNLWSTISTGSPFKEIFILESWLSFRCFPGCFLQFTGLLLFREPFEIFLQIKIILSMRSRTKWNN